MHRVLVVFFNDETKAHEGENVLLRFDRKGSIIVYGHAVLAKKADGTVKLMQKQDLVVREKELSQLSRRDLPACKRVANPMGAPKRD